MIDITSGLTFRNSAAILAATTLATTCFPEPFNFGHRIIRSLSEGILNPIFGGAMDALQTQTGKHFNASEAGSFAKKTISGFINGTEYKAGDGGKAIGDTLKEEFKTLFLSIGIDPEKMGPAEVAALVIDKVKAGQLSAKFMEMFNEIIQGALSNDELAEMFLHLTEELHNIIETATPELGKTFREAVKNTGTPVLKGITFDLLPYVLGTMSALIATPLTLYYLYQKAVHQIGRPQLANETHQNTILTPLTERTKNAVAGIFGFKREKKMAPIFNPYITRRVKELSLSTKHILKNGGYFQNVLFYGPGGTGKTMISESIAANSGMSYIKMSGGDLAQYIKRGEHVTELHKLMDKMNLSWRPWSTRPWILYIDEADSLCRDRDKIASAELLELQNALLNRTGTQSRNFMLILSTNRMEDMDEAILTRLDHKIFIGPPAEEERIKIIKSYLPQFFSPAEQAAFFTDSQVKKIGEATQGLTGRALFKLLNITANKKASTAKNKLTQPMIDEAIQDIITQEKELERRRALRAHLSEKAPKYRRALAGKEIGQKRAE